jgi:hypothetical protein
LGVPKRQEVEGNLALVRFESGPRTVSAPVFVGSPKEEEAHWTVLEGFENLAKRSLQTLLRILTEDHLHAVEVRVGRGGEFPVSETLHQGLG